MFISSGISILILCFSLCSNAMNFTQNQVDNACNYEYAMVNLAGGLSVNGTNDLLSTFLQIDIAILRVMVAKVCNNKSALYNKQGHLVPKEVLDGIALKTGCGNNVIAAYQSICDKFKSCYNSFTTTTGKIHEIFVNIKTEILKIKVASYDNIAAPMLKNLKVRLGKENRTVADGIVQNYFKIVDVFRSLL